MLADGVWFRSWGVDWFRPLGPTSETPSLRLRLGGLGVDLCKVFDNSSTYGMSKWFWSQFNRFPKMGYPKNICVSLLKVLGSFQLRKFHQVLAEIVQQEFLFENSFYAKLGKQCSFPSGLALMCKPRTQGSWAKKLTGFLAVRCNAVKDSFVLHGSWTHLDGTQLASNDPWSRLLDLAGLFWQEKIVLQKREYVRLIHRMTGVERVAAQPKVMWRHEGSVTHTHTHTSHVYVHKEDSHMHLRTYLHAWHIATCNTCVKGNICNTSRSAPVGGATKTLGWSDDCYDWFPTWWWERSSGSMSLRIMTSHD